MMNIWNRCAVPMVAKQHQWQSFHIRSCVNFEFCTEVNSYYNCKIGKTNAKLKYNT